MHSLCLGALDLTHAIHQRTVCLCSQNGQMKSASRLILLSCSGLGCTLKMPVQWCFQVPECDFLEVDVRNCDAWPTKALIWKTLLHESFNNEERLQSVSATTWFLVTILMAGHIYWQNLWQYWHNRVSFGIKKMGSLQSPCWDPVDASFNGLYMSPLGIAP